MKVKIGRRTFTVGQSVRGGDLPEPNVDEAYDNLGSDLDGSIWVFDAADPQGLWDDRVQGVYPITASFLKEVEVLKKKIRKSKRIDPVTVDEVTPWVEGQHRIRAAIDLGYDMIYGFFKEE